jgi:hypothetical protein
MFLNIMIVHHIKKSTYYVMLKYIFQKKKVYHFVHMTLFNFKKIFTVMVFKFLAKVSWLVEL